MYLRTRNRTLHNAQKMRRQKLQITHIIKKTIMTQREIKFRGKSEDNNEWIYGYFVDLNDGKEPNIFGDHNDFYPVIPETVGQYTGLKDRNGKEIYEGDIIRLDGSDSKTIKFIDGKAAFCIANVDELKYEEYRWIHVWHHINSVWWQGFCKEIEVIGNIHDNSELLKE